MKKASTLAALTLLLTSSYAFADGAMLPFGPASVGTLLGIGANVGTALGNAADTTGGILTVGTSGATGCRLSDPCTWAAAQAFNGGITINMSGAGGILETQALTGTSLAGIDANYVNITSDNMNLGTGFGIGQVIIHNFGGSAMLGGRQPFTVFSAMTAASNASNTNRNYVAGTFVETANSGDNGSGMSYLGAHFALGAEATACGVNDGTFLCSSSSPGATNLLELTAGEMNVAAHTGSTVYYKSIWTLVGRNDDAVHGINIDAMESLSNQSGAVTWGYGIQFHSGNGEWPIASTGTLIGATAGSAANGDDYSNVTFSGCSFKSNHFCVVNSGNIQSDTGAVEFQNANGGILWQGVVDGNTASSTDYPTLHATAATNNLAYIIPAGADANINFGITTLGTGKILLAGGGAIPWSGEASLEILGSASNSSYLTINGSSSGAPTIGCGPSACLVAVGNELSVTDTTASSSTATGAITDAGGLGVAGASFFGGKLTLSVPAPASGGFFGATQITVSTDNANMSGALYGLGVLVNFGGASATGSRYGISSQMIQVTATSASNPDRNYVATYSEVNTTSGDGGTGTGGTGSGSLGGYFAEAQQCFNSGGTNVLETSCQENDVAWTTGSTGWWKNGISVVSIATDNAHGTVFDNGYSLSGTGGAAGFNVGFEICTCNGGTPMTSTATAFLVDSNITLGTVLDMEGTVNTNFLKYGSIFSVNSAGNILTDGTLVLNNTNIGTGASAGIQLENTTAATSGATVQNSPTLFFVGNGWNTTSLASNGADWRVLLQPFSGATVTSALKWFTQINGAGYTNVMSWGSAGSISLASTLTATGGILTAAAPTVAASQIGYGGTVTANTSCGTLSGSAGCVVINVAGTNHFVPYY